MANDFKALIPELSRWNEGRGIDVRDWICCVGDFEHLIGYLELLWPAFVEHQGCVFREGFSEQSFAGFMKQTGGDKRSVEAVMNHVHVERLFGDPELAPTMEQLLHIGRKLRDLWSCKLRCDFPDRRFVVRFPEDRIEHPLDYEITFFQESHEPAA